MWVSTKSLHSREWLNGISSESESHSDTSDSLRPHELCSPWNSPGQNTGVGSLSILQGLFPTQGSNPGFPYYRFDFFDLSKKERKRGKGREAMLGLAERSIVLTHLKLHQRRLILPEAFKRKLFPRVFENMI